VSINIYDEFKVYMDIIKSRFKFVRILIQHYDAV